MTLIKGSERIVSSLLGTFAMVSAFACVSSVLAQTDKEQAEPKATHQQTAIIKVLGQNESSMQLHSFCLNADGNILAAVGETPGEIRVFDAEGKLLTSWKTPVRPEAVNVGPDGSVYVAGGGRVLKFSSSGELLLSKQAPHAASLKANAAKLRETVIQQSKQRGLNYQSRIDVYQAQIDRFQKEIDKLTSKGEGNITATDRQRITAYNKSVDMYQRSLEAYKKALADNPVKEMSEEEIQAQVKRMVESKLRVSSVSATEEDVFVACRASEGYGFDVWRTNLALEHGKQIIEGLRGCCGQMDVRADGEAVYVAENARHRVCRYDRDGEMTREWGERARTGVKGFGSCCNPMNVAFGTNGEVYTAESTTGRIKCYDSAGKLLSLVGSVELVPGCKNVSIAASDDGDRLYMLDITRKHIVVMTRKPKTTTVAASQPETE